MSHSHEPLLTPISESCSDNDLSSLDNPNSSDHSLPINPPPLADPYIYETVAILRKQLKEHGIIPLEYLPLHQMKAEMETLIQACNAGAKFDEDRLDHLIRCMDYNPEHQREKEEVALEWRRSIQPLIDEVIMIS